ncbi:MAG: caspase family protein [Candidatus Eremiobacteraeota bacterium]|nr:caspase family protein [Candidatus Eremiobacteraeota bacterium]MCW5865809.1 caspase family protein [Candidatus Eremiobacteraeota bacterium]
MRKGLLVFSCLAGVAWGEGKTYAVVVGIDNYLNPNVPKLRYAVSDANIFAQALKQTLKVPESQLFLLTSDSPDDASHPRAVNIANRLAWLNSHVKREDTIIFYFAGHGITMDKQPYLLTEESDNSNTLTLGVSSLPGAALMDYLSKVKAANVWLVLDACRNSASREPNSLGDVSFTRTDVGQDRSATMFSCKIGERSWESEEFEHGFYTYYLVAGLREKAVDDKGEINLQGLSDFVGSQVPVAVAKMGQKQTPWLSYGGGDRWVLARGLKPASGKAAVKADAELAQYVAKLEMTQAELDRETARRVAAEARAQMLEGKRIELEQRLAILEKKLGLKSGPTAAAPTAPNTLAYGDRGLGNADQREALKAEVTRLKAENTSLNQRLAKLEENMKQIGMVSREAFVLQDDMVQATDQFDAKQDVTSQFERYLELGENAMTQFERAAKPAVTTRTPSQQEARELEILEKRQIVTMETNKVLRARRETAEARIKSLESQLAYFKTRADYYAAQLAAMEKKYEDKKLELNQANQTYLREKMLLEQKAVASSKRQDEYDAWERNHPEYEPIRSGKNPWQYQAVQRMPYLLELNVPEAQYFPAKDK